MKFQHALAFALFAAGLAFYAFGRSFLAQSQFGAIADLFDIAFAAFALYVFSLVWTSPKFKQAEKRVWLLLSVGLGFWLLGEVTWGMREIIFGLKNRFPSEADFFWIVGYPFLIAGVSYDLKNRFTVETKLSKLHLITAGVSAIVVSLLIFGAPEIFSISTASADKMLNLLYTAGDFILFFLVILIALVHVIENWKYGILDTSKAWLLVGIGFALHSAFDVLFASLNASGTYVSGDPIDFLYDIAYWLLAVGALYYVQLSTGGRD